MTLPETEKKPESPAKRVIGLCVRYLVPLALTVLLVWYMFRKVN